MFELKWTDQDMIDFANYYSEIDISDRHLARYVEDKKRQAIAERVNKLVSMVAMDEKLLEKLEKVINDKNK